MPVVALLLPLLALTAPTPLRAPLDTRPILVAPQPIDERVPRSATRGAAPALDDERVAGPPATVADDPRLALRYQHALDAARELADADGATFAVVRHGRLVWTGASGTTRDGRTPLVADAPLVIGSVTKTFVAATVLQLIGEGLIALDDPIADHLPELAAIAPGVTVGQLLDHTSGLADLFNDTTRRGLEEHPERSWTAAEILATLHEPWYEPGEGWAYANTNYFLLGMLVERITGAPLADEVGRRFTGPLGLHATRVLDGGPGDPLRPAWTTIFWASGAMVSSASDLARWGEALYAGPILERPLRRAMLRMNDHDHGLGVQRLELAGAVGHGHTGLLDTYTTLLLHLPDDEVTVALIANRSRVDLEGMLSIRPGDGPSLLELALGGPD